MSDYSKITNFLSKDSLSLNDPAKYVKGSEIDAECNAIAASIATKADTASPTLVTPNIGAATGTSLALGGGTALTTTNRTGTGNLVLATAPTLTGLTVSGGNFVSRGISDTATAVALTLSGSGANSVTVANSATNPTIGTSGGGLSLSPAGLPGLIVNAVASAVNYAVINQAAAGSAVSFVANGSDVDIPLYISSKGAQNVGVYTGGLSLPQVFVTHTASADRYITLTGANAANPKIATSAGSLDIGSPVVFTSQTVGTTVGAAGGASALPATPLGYITTSINGTACKIPYYTA